jgi:hypothetical protein
VYGVDGKGNIISMFETAEGGDESSTFNPAKMALALQYSS